MRLSHMLTVAALALAAAGPAFAQENGRVNFEFSEADQDADGLLTADELARLMPAFAGMTAAKQLIAAMDEDGDGKASIAELSNPANHRPVSVVSAPQVAIMADFADADLNKDGKVTLAELDANETSLVASMHEDYVKAADANGDGWLSKSEWEAKRPTMTVAAETRGH